MKGPFTGSGVSLGQGSSGPQRRRGRAGGSELRGWGLRPAASPSAGAGLPFLCGRLLPVQAPLGVCPRPGRFPAQPVLGLRQPRRPAGGPLDPAAPEPGLTARLPPQARAAMRSSGKRHPASPQKGGPLPDGPPRAEDPSRTSHRMLGAQTRGRTRPSPRGSGEEAWEAHELPPAGAGALGSGGAAPSPPLRTLWLSPQWTGLDALIGPHPSAELLTPLRRLTSSDSQAACRTIAQRCLAVSGGVQRCPAVPAAHRWGCGPRRSAQGRARVLTDGAGAAGAAGWERRARGAVSQGARPRGACAVTRHSLPAVTARPRLRGRVWQKHVFVEPASTWLGAGAEGLSRASRAARSPAPSVSAESLNTFEHVARASLQAASLPRGAVREFCASACVCSGLPGGA